MMTALRSTESVGWVPEFEFEVWSLGIDCKKYHADCCWQLAQQATDAKEAELLKDMAQKQWNDNKALSTRINSTIDNLLGDFYTNGGQPLQGSLPEATRQKIHELLNEIESYEAKDIAISLEASQSAVDYAREQEAFYRSMFLKMADFYPEGAVKNAFKQLTV